MKIKRVEFVFNISNDAINTFHFPFIPFFKLATEKRNYGQYKDAHKFQISKLKKDQTYCHQGEGRK
jgi:hypothetical protein